MGGLCGFNTYDEPIELPPGFRFHPTDEELVTHYLSRKVVDRNFVTKAIGEVDLNKVEPWDLPWKAKMGEKEWYFFCLRDRKYPTGTRTNRATEAGYWKATGKDREIFRAKSLVGMKKTLVFYRGRAPRGEKTNWVMHEFRLEGKHSTHNPPKTSKNEWVICRLFKKTSGGKKLHISGLLRSGDDSQLSDLPPLMDLSSDENHVRTPSATTAEFSSSSSKNCDFSSPLPFSFPQLSTNPGFPPQSIAQIQSLNHRDQDQSISRPANDDNRENTAQNDKGEVSQGMSYDYEDQEFPYLSAAQIDLDCLWNY